MSFEINDQIRCILSGPPCITYILSMSHSHNFFDKYYAQQEDINKSC